MMKSAAGTSKQGRATAVPAVIASGIAVLVIVLTAGIYRWNFPGAVSGVHSRWGEFGDFLGGVLNPIFGFFSFLALLYALVLQSKELQASTAALESSAAALQLQNKALKKQNFESTFFQLLKRFAEVGDGLRLGSLRGSDVLEKLVVIFKGKFNGKPCSASDVVREYESLYRTNHNALGHYFRTLYHVFTFIDRSDFSDEEKVIYANIARSQLSSNELFLLFYNGVVGQGRTGFRPLIAKYGILKHIDRTQLVDPSHMDDGMFYQGTAFLSAEGRATQPPSAVDEPG